MLPSLAPRAWRRRWDGRAGAGELWDDVEELDVAMVAFAVERIAELPGTSPEWPSQAIVEVSYARLRWAAQVAQRRRLGAVALDALHDRRRGGGTRPRGGVRGGPARRRRRQRAAPARRGADLRHPRPLRHGNFHKSRFKPAVRAAGLPEGLRFHDLTHTYAAFCIASTADPYAVMRRMGHASITVTYDTCGHLFPERDAEITDALDGLVQRGVDFLWTRREPRGTSEAST